MGKFSKIIIVKGKTRATKKKMDKSYWKLGKRNNNGGKFKVENHSLTWQSMEEKPNSHYKNYYTSFMKVD